MNKIVKVITASVLTVSMCGCAVSADEAKSTAAADTVSSEKKSSKKDASEAYTSQQTGKDETVYVFTGADGSMNHMVVSDILHTAGKKGAVEDYSNLDNIENVSGDEKYSSDDNGNITWTSDGSDISYQGTTDKELPVDVKITYYLNGNEVSPEEIKGQSGHVKVHFDYTNNAETTITSNGEEKTVKVPFGMVTGLTLDASKFTNVTVTNGKMNQYNDSDVIYGLALPGLKESLETASVSDIDLTSVNIPEYFEFEADTTDFDIDLCMTIATSNLLSLLNTDDLNVSDFSGSIDQLTSSGQKLVDGTKSLKDGTSQLKSGADSLDSGAQSLLNGAGTLSDGASSLSTGTNDLANGAQSLSDGASQVNDGASSLADGAATLAKGASDLDTGIGSAQSGMNELANGLKTLSSNSAALNAGYAEVAQGILDSVNDKLKAAGYQPVTEGNFATQLGTYGGVTDKMRQTALQTAASQNNTTVDKVKTLIYATSVLNNGNITDATLASTKTRLEDDLKYTADASKAVAEVSDGAYKTDTAVAALASNMAASVKKAIDNGNGNEYVQKAYDAILTDIVNNVKTAKQQTITNDQAAEILAMTLENQDKLTGTTAEDKITQCAGLVLTGQAQGLTSPSSVGLANNDVRLYAAAKAKASVTSNSLGILVDTVKNAAAAQGQNIDNATALAIIVYAANHYDDEKTLNDNIVAASAALSKAKEAKTFSDGATSGSEIINSYLNTAVENTDSYKKMPSQLKEALKSLTGVYTLKAKLREYTDGVDSAYAGAQKLVDGMATLKSGSEQLKSGADKLVSGASTLAAGTKSLADGAVSLNDGAQKLKSGAATLYNGSLTLYSGVKTLKNGTSSLKTGVVTLDDGAATLESGMEQFYEEGIKKIGDVLGKDLPAVVDSLKGLTNAGADYKTYSGALDDDNNTCKFIFKTEFDSDNK